MVNVKNLSPESRVKNELESLYFGVKSGDVETEELFRYKVQQAFADHDVCLNDKLSPDTLADTLRTVMLDTCKEMAKELQGGELSPEQIQTIERNFDSLKDNYDRFYETIFDSFEERYDYYERVDDLAFFERMRQGVDPFQPLEESETIFEWQENELTTEERMILIAMEEAYNRDKKERSGLSYVGHVPEAKTQVAKRSYKQIREEEKAAHEEMKGTKYDKKYEEYVRSRGDNPSDFTAGDAYGFDEHDQYIRLNELEDDGPEL